MSEPTTGSGGQLQTLAVRITKDLRAQLDVVAQITGRNTTEEIRLALEHWVEKIKSDPATLKKAARIRAEIEREGNAAMLVILDPAMTKAQTARLEKKLADGEIRAWDIPTAYELREVLAAVHKDRILLGHCPSDEEKALAPRITAAIRDHAASPRVDVRTSALGGGRFRVRLPTITAAYVGLDSTERTTYLTSLEQAAGITITVESVGVSHGNSWFRTVLFRACPRPTGRG